MRNTLDFSGRMISTAILPLCTKIAKDKYVNECSWLFSCKTLLEKQTLGQIWAIGNSFLMTGPNSQDVSRE